MLTAEVRGTVHRLPVEDGPAHSALVKPGVRARLPLILPGTSTVVCVSDSDGEDGIDFAPEDGGETRRILSDELGRVLELAAAPDGKTLAVAGDDGRLLLVDVETGAATESGSPRQVPRGQGPEFLSGLGLSGLGVAVDVEGGTSEEACAGSGSPG